MPTGDGGETGDVHGFGKGNACGDFPLSATGRTQPTGIDWEAGD